MQRTMPAPASKRLTHARHVPFLIDHASPNSVAAAGEAGSFGPGDDAARGRSETAGGRAELQPLVAEGLDDRFEARVHAELAEEGPYVVARGLLGDLHPR